MPLVLRNAILADLDPPRVETGSLRIDAGQIVARGEMTPAASDEIIDCGGAVVLPGMVNGHTHLYSALAVGMPPPPRPPKNFYEILQLVWWRLDRALDAESIEASARIGALEAVRCGTTTLIDHHASPNCIADSLNAIEHGLDSIGLRGVLCYEVTDRNGRAGRDEGIEENRRYTAKCSQHASTKFAALAGAHASFTLDDESLAAVAAFGAQSGVGVHIHVAEDPCDGEITRERYHKPLIERLGSHQILGPEHVLAHCIHLSDSDIEVINEAQPTVAHNPRSNMNNAVGYSPIAKLKCPIMLGTDGIGADMFTEARHAWFKSCDAHAGLVPQDILRMLATSARRASSSLGITLGQLAVGAAADIVITDYVPFTQLTANNLAAHFIFALSAQHVRHVLVGGHLVLKDRAVSALDETTTRKQAMPVASQMWRRMQAIPAGR
jgi:putative selenium metabolism protein SsnA